jgi:micrococcal nuclease
MQVQPAYRYRATITRWIDGDTVQLRLDLGFEVTIHVTCRVYGLNTPELRSGTAETRKLGQVALQAAREIAAPGTDVTIESVKGGQEKFGRYLARIILQDGKVFADEMIALGHGQAYDGGERKPTRP